ncbi:hypothetical protein T02_12215 [Trichinella nativa]|uniref:Uncharacterized protein n=1 Tax=Trichinella nativa TaxID=6335 RepID=A0A0V1KJM1_9BILA|nr:hypothetical protein T02_12215 [Trichinella nativa]
MIHCQSTASLLGIAAASVTDVQLSPHCCSFICARHAIITAASSFDVQDRECMCRMLTDQISLAEKHLMQSANSELYNLVDIVCMQS